RGVDRMKRRQYITLIGGAAVAWPLAARAQQAAMPVVGILAVASPEANAIRLCAFREGLSTAGYVEGKNVNIEYRWAEAYTGRLPELAARFVEEQMAVLVTAGGTSSAVAAKAATASIPIVFGIAADPIDVGLVASLNRPGGNVTGVTSLNIEVAPKRLELLHELLPSVTTMGLLVNLAVPALAAPVSRISQGGSSLTRAAAACCASDPIERASASRDDHGSPVSTCCANTDGEIEAAFKIASRKRIGALVLAASPFFDTRRDKLVALAASHALPTIYHFREFAVAGGLMSYGVSIPH